MAKGKDKKIKQIKGKNVSKSFNIHKVNDKRAKKAKQGKNASGVVFDKSLKNKQVKIIRNLDAKTQVLSDAIRTTNTFKKMEQKKTAKPEDIDAAILAMNNL